MNKSYWNGVAEEAKFVCFIASVLIGIAVMVLGVCTLHNFSHFFHWFVACNCLETVFILGLIFIPGEVI